jgi:RNA polymerase sigma factor (sigma-70 family)
MAAEASGVPDFERLKERRPEEVQVWFERYFGVVHGFVRRRVAACPDLAGDVTQEVFLVALRSIQDYDPNRGAMLPWLTYIARNCARKALRQVRPSALVVTGVDEAGLRERLPSLDASPLPEDVLLRAEVVDRVHAALASLAPQYQRALENHYFLEQPLQEMASAEATSVASVKSLLHRARLAFREAFEGRLDLDEQAFARRRSR